MGAPVFSSPWPPPLVRSLSLFFFLSIFLIFPSLPEEAIGQRHDRQGTGKVWLGSLQRLQPSPQPSLPIAAGGMASLAHLAPWSLHPAPCTSGPRRRSRPPPLHQTGAGEAVHSGAPSHFQPRVVTDSIISIARRNMTALPAPGASLKRDVYG